jgi:predicted TIM-barrel fold metal-dependent hydrolase
MNRRQFLSGLGVVGASGLAYASYKFWPEQGLFNPCLSVLPDDILGNPLMQKIWQGIDASQVWDSHVHLVGTGDSQSSKKNSGVWVNPSMDSYWHPILKIQKKFYMNGSCAAYSDIDQSAVQRMARLSAEMPTGFKMMLFAFDWFHDMNGQPDQARSIFHISNEYAAKTASEHSQYFEWVASIHPYRADAVDALEQVKAQGARAIKWLPQGMGIDPANAKCAAFYAACARLDIPIICHTGHERAVQGGNQDDANPLKLRRALEAGVRIVLAHCASDGDGIDYDNSNRKIKNFDLFLRLMEAPQYKDLLFGEISAITLINHAWAIQPLLERTDLHSCLLNGSDYPLPAILPIISLKQLVSKNLLDESHVNFLQTIRLYNPIMFDFALKRLLRFGDSTFPTSVFETKNFFV